MSPQTFLPPEAAYFATAPFAGALGIPLLGETLRRVDIAGGTVMVLGVALLISARRARG